MAGSERKLTVVIAGDSRGATKALGDVETKASGFGSKIGGLSNKAKVAFAGLGIGVLKFGSDSVAAYSESEEAQKRLADAFDRFPKLADTSQAALQKINSALQKKTKFDDDAIASGQAVIAQFGLTGSQLESITPLLVDYASRTGKDMPAAAQDMGKALLGNAKALKNIGIKYTATGDTAKDFANIQALLSKQVGGFAEKEGTTAAGKAKILANQFGELEEQVGGFLVPALSKLASVGLTAITWLQNPAVRTGAILLAGVAAAIVSVNLATRGWTAATQAWGAVQKVATGVQWAFNTALSANPIALVVLAIAALAAGVVLAYQKVGWFHDAVDKLGSFFKNTLWPILQSVAGWIVGTLGPVFVGIGNTVAGVVGFIRNHWQAILAILTGPVGVAVKIIHDHWDGITRFFAGIPHAIASAFSGLAGAISSPFRSAFSAVKSLWNNTIGGFSFSIPSWVPKVGGKSFKIPRMHTGGIFAPGSSEGFALLKRGEGVFTPEQMKALGPTSSGPAVYEVKVDLTGAVISNKFDLQRMLRDALQNIVQREGRIAGTNIAKTSIA